MVQDNNVIQRPKCNNPKCNEFGLIYFGDVLLCGDCATKLNNKKNKLIHSQLEDL